LQKQRLPRNTDGKTQFQTLRPRGGVEEALNFLFVATAKAAPGRAIVQFSGHVESRWYADANHISDEVLPPTEY
jgi:hypothetical protein